MKKLLHFVVAAMLWGAANAQEVQEGKVMLGKTEMPGFTATSQSRQEKVESVIAEKLAEYGVQLHKKKNKFYTYNGILIRDISPNKIDLYYKVEKKKKKSVIYFSVSKGYDNHVTSGSDAVAAANIKHFLSSIDATIAHNEEVKDKQKEIDEANEKLKKAQEEKERKTREMEDIKDKN